MSRRAPTSRTASRRSDEHPVSPTTARAVAAPATPPSTRPVRRRARVAAAAVVALLLIAAPAAVASDEGATWQFAPASPPPPPPGVAGGTLPVPLGQVGDIEFWAPNRGLLITGGTGSSCAASAGATVPCGLYAYNGESWHLLSTVCGGANGRIAWAGPDEFWTISDQRPGQVVVTGAEYGNVSLCHFVNGQVVASYAVPLNQPFSYLPMDAAACLTPSNCWFGGELGQPPNSGAFHLHWDGEHVSIVYNPADHAVGSMALAGPGTLLESVQLATGDRYGTESPENPFVLHQIDPPGSSVDFHDLFPPNSACAALEFCPPLPLYGVGGEGEEVAPYTLAGFSLSSDYSPSGSNPGPPQLWAVAGPNGVEPRSSSEGEAHPLALRLSAGMWSQVVGGEGPNGEGPGGSEPFAPGEIPQKVAAEPGAAAAWVTLRSGDGEAHVARLTAQGTISERDVLGRAQGVGSRGTAGPIACPAPHDCWLATNQGWLFHLTAVPPGAPSPLALDTDPNFAGVITFRPPDEGVPQLPPDEPPPDNSLENQQPPPAPAPPPVVTPPQLARKALVTGMHSHVVRRYYLELTFKLTVKGRVQLVATRRGRRVAETAKMTLKAGRHTLTLRLNPGRWPNKLSFNAVPLEALPTVTVSPGGSSGGQTVAPPVGAESVST